MAELKTKPTDQDVSAYLDSVEDEKKRQDSYAILALMQEVTGEEARMWGSSMIGFGSYHYTYESGREGDWFLTGFAPRKRNLTLYIMAGFEAYGELLAKLGKYKTGKSCLYINKFDDVDTAVLRQLVQASVEHMKQTNQ
ncbi:MAG: DUF1801 domain-containing protein [Chloroflexota bacterium]